MSGCDHLLHHPLFQHPAAEHNHDFLYAFSTYKIWNQKIFPMPLQWRQNERDGVSSNQPHDCLLNSLLRSRSKKTSKFRVTGFCAGNSPVTRELPAQMASDAVPFYNVIVHYSVNRNLRLLPTQAVVFSHKEPVVQNVDVSFIKRRVKLRIHSPTSTMQPFKFQNRCVISPHTL